MKYPPLRVAATTAAVVLFSWAVLLNLWVKSDRAPGIPSTSKAAAATSVDSLVESIRSEGGVEKLKVQEVEGILIIRGNTRDQNVRDRVGELAKSGGFQRVANLIQVRAIADDELIAREAERRLGEAPGLDGCRFHITSSEGVVRITGVVQHELQKDLVHQLARRVTGVRKVQTDLQRIPTTAPAAAGRG